LAGKSQVKEVTEKVRQLMQTQKVVFGDLEKFEVTGADKSKGAFLPPVRSSTSSRSKTPIATTSKPSAP
jgi:hypothetical protein